MIRHRRTTAAVVTSLGLVVSVLMGTTQEAIADATLHYDLVVRKPVEESKEVTWYLAEGKMAVTTDGSKSSRLIYWAEDDRLALVDDSKKEYIELTGSELTEMAEMMSHLGTQLEQAMDGLTPEQREKMKEALGKSGMGGSGKKKLEIEVLPMSETKTINGFECRKNEIVTGGSKSAEVWAVATSDTTVTPAEFASMQAMGSLLGRLLEAFSSVAKPLELELPLPAGLGSGLQGIPVYTKDLEGDAIEAETTLTRLDRSDIDKDAFEIGKGYKKQELMPAGK